MILIKNNNDVRQQELKSNKKTKTDDQQQQMTGKLKEFIITCSKYFHSCRYFR